LGSKEIGIGKNSTVVLTSWKS